MSSISAGTTAGSALVSAGDTTGDLILRVNGTTPSVSLKANGSVGFGSTPGYGTSGQVLTSAGTGAAPTWAAAGALTLLATITPTAATTIQSLNLFTSTYDNYLIVYNNIQTSSATGTCTLNLRLAVAGAVVSTGSYRSGTTISAAPTQDNINLLFGGSTLDPVYQPVNGQITINNVNSTYAPSYKGMWGSCIMQAAGSTVGLNGVGVFSSNSVVTGFSMYLLNGVNFAAQGSVRVYGYANS